MVVHNLAGLKSLDGKLNDWRIEWKPTPFTDGIGCRHLDDPTATIVIDVFLATRFDYELQGVPKPALVKTLATKDFLPSVEFLLIDKIRTVPNRQGPDAYEKQAKDLLDIHHLVFHNLAGLLPGELLATASAGERREAASRVERSRNLRPSFDQEYRTVHRWLTTDS